MSFKHIICTTLLGLAFSGSHANNTATTQCKPPPNLAQNHFWDECVGEQSWGTFSDNNQSSFDIGLMDAEGKILLSAEYTRIFQDRLIKNQFYATKEKFADSKQTFSGVFNHKLEWIVPLEKQLFLDIYLPSTVLRVKREVNGEEIYALFDKKSGQFSTPFKYTSLSRFQDGLAIFSTEPIYKYGLKNKELKFGFINEQGQEVIGENYVSIAPFSEGITNAQDANGDRWIIDNTGQKLWKIPYHYNQLSFSLHGRMMVANRHDEMAIINQAGEEVIPFGRFDKLYLLNKIPAIVAHKADKIGLLDLQGNELLPLGEFDGAEDSLELDDNAVVFYKGDQFWRYDEKGKLLQTAQSRYSQPCKQIKVGDKYPKNSKYIVSKVISYRNIVELNAEDVDYTVVDTCEKFVKLAAKSKKRQSSKSK